MDTSPLHPPAGAKVAILEFEDLECPSCAHAYPLVHAVAQARDIPLVRYDYPLRSHHWSRQAAVFARNLQDNISAQAADKYRGQVFARQLEIDSIDDLHQFSKRFLAQQHLPAAVARFDDPKAAAEVEADHALGDRIGIQGTPTIWVVTPTSWVEIQDLSTLDDAVAKALTQ